MQILSQNKDILVNYDNSSHIWRKGNTIYVDTASLDTIILGRYPSIMQGDAVFTLLVDAIARKDGEKHLIEMPPALEDADQYHHPLYKELLKQENQYEENSNLD